jgi:hypothetical protein
MIQEVYKLLNHMGADAAMSTGERDGTEEHGASNYLTRRRRAHATGV